jgi:DNA-binding cell septation regulator SpoVG
MEGKGNLKAFADITIGGSLAIHGCRIVQQQGQQAWVSMPQSEYMKNGKKNYYPIVKVLDKQLQADIERAILAAYEKGE